jgi:hypothetical protein
MIIGVANRIFQLTVKIIVIIIIIYIYFYIACLYYLLVSLKSFLLRLTELLFILNFKIHLCLIFNWFLFI